MTTKDKLIILSESVEGTNDLSRFIADHDDISIAKNREDLPIDFKVEGIQFEQSTEDVDFEKCDAAASEILDTIKTYDLNFFETVAVLQKIHTKIDPEGGDALK